MEKSSFKYWFAHWCSFQMVAINLGIWKPRFLFHDWEKPWLKLFLPYDKVRKIHRRFSKHHMNSPRKKDYLATVVDWECSKLTKPDNQLNAREFFNYYSNANKWQCEKDKVEIETLLNKLKL